MYNYCNDACYVFFFSYLLLVIEGEEWDRMVARQWHDTIGSKFSHFNEDKSDSNSDIQSYSDAAADSDDPSGTAQGEASVVISGHSSIASEPNSTEEEVSEEMRRRSGKWRSRRQVPWHSPGISDVSSREEEEEDMKRKKGVRKYGRQGEVVPWHSPGISDVSSREEKEQDRDMRRRKGVRRVGRRSEAVPLHSPGVSDVGISDVSSKEEEEQNRDMRRRKGVERFGRQSEVVPLHSPGICNTSSRVEEREELNEGVKRRKKGKWRLRGQEGEVPIHSPCISEASSGEGVSNTGKGRLRRRRGVASPSHTSQDISEASSGGEGGVMVGEGRKGLRGGEGERVQDTRTGGSDLTRKRKRRSWPFHHSSTPIKFTQVKNNSYTLY